MDLTVKFRDCACPETPHPKGDTVTFRERLSFDAAARAVAAIYSGEGVHGMSQNAFSVYLHEGPVAWNLVDDKGAPVELTEQALDDLPFADQYEIADAADTIYAGTVLSPLVRRMSKSSAIGPTTDSSPTPTTGSSTTPGRSRRSSEASTDESTTSETS